MAFPLKFNADLQWLSKDNVVQIVLVLTVAYLISVLIFRWLKDLPKNLPPGPRGLPIVGYAPFLGADPNKALLKLGEKYGSSIIGLKMGSKYTVFLNDYCVMKETLSHASALDRSPEILGNLPSLGFGGANGEEWTEQRRFCLQAMRDLGLGRSSWETMVQEELASFISELSSYKGAPVDISQSLSESVNNNIISLLIGRRLQKGKEDKTLKLSVDFAEAAFLTTEPLHPANLIPSLRKYLEVFKIEGVKKAADIITNFFSFLRDEIKKHQKQDSEGTGDFINIYQEKINQKLKEKSAHYFSDKNLEGNINVLFLGGSDTIFTSLSWLFRLMCEHKDIQRKVQKELDDVIGRNGSATYEERHKIPYTFAVMMESQRVSSIVPLSSTRRANSDFVIRGYTIPKGSEIIGNTWAIHNDPEYWSEPEKFIPERFLTEDKKKLIKTPPSFVPFSTGKRNCPGETVAWIEILVYFTSVMQRFNVSTPPGVKPLFEVINGLVTHLKPQKLCFTEREN